MADQSRADEEAGSDSVSCQLSAVSCQPTVVASAKSGAGNLIIQLEIYNRGISN